jgi:toxin ParE1/3/4
MLNVRSRQQDVAFRLSNAAGRDLEHVFADGIQKFGRKQALRYSEDLETVFQRIADNPLLYRERFEVHPPVRIVAFHAHLILYQIEGDDVLIGRVLHGHEDWQSGDKL